MLAKVNAQTGSPDLDVWQILVLGILKQGLRIDFDRLCEMANEHRTLLHMLAHGLFDETHYRLQRLVDNVALLTLSLLQDSNGLLVRCGHAALGESGEAPLRRRCDSFVVGTDVHYPTDVSLPWDALRGLLRSTGRSAGKHDMGGWRQLTPRVRRRFNAVRETRRAQVAADPGLPADLSDPGGTGGEQPEGVAGGRSGEEEGPKDRRVHRCHTQRQIEQVDRRLLQGETIPHEEKVFSVFEEHTRWISKGKAGVAVELGVPVCGGGPAPVPAASQGDVEGQRCGRDGADDPGDAAAVSDAEGVQFRPRISQSGEPGGTGPVAGPERVAGQGEVEQGEPGAGGGAGISGGVAAALGGGIGDQPPGAPRYGSGVESGSGRWRCRCSERTSVGWGGFCWRRSASRRAGGSPA